LTVARCSSCGAEIEWAETRAGNKLPLDVGSFEDGNILVAEHFDGRVIATVTRTGGGDRRSHFATCPNAGEHRKSRR
jgi:hypothetical protein